MLQSVISVGLIGLIFSLLADRHGLVSALSAAVVVSVIVGVGNNFSSLLFWETTAPNPSKLYTQLPYIGVYKNSSLHVDPIVDLDFIGLWNFVKGY